METLHITKENALTAYKNGCSDVKRVLVDLLGKETFVPKNITDQVKTFEDACQILGIQPDNFSFQIDTAMKGDMASITGYTKLIIIARALNEGWTPDWNNQSQYKYVPWFKEKSGFGLSFHGYVYWSSDTDVGSRLCYKTKELAEYAGKQFADLYKDFLSL